MEILLDRKYFATGTNGTLFHGTTIVCKTIELPDKQNAQGISCIPEGRYSLLKRSSLKHGRHLLVKPVQGRELILIHKANNELKELRGCIAPVTSITGEGTGTESRKAFDTLIKVVYTAIDKGDLVFLNIKSHID